ncbi:translation initiation factor IF-3 [Candidatus Sumerlaeota bacterium]|nr:translation initiation factor IF-3 [Candidatus Sumerlaeota bacterium]
MIRARDIRLIEADGSQAGVMPLEQALQRAQELELDLVEVAPNSNPPVCRIQDYKKFLYEQRKKLRDQRKKNKQQELKEIKMRPRIDDHDFEFKADLMKKFLKQGHKCKLTIQFRGRENQYREIGREIAERVTEYIEGTGQPETRLSTIGQFMNQIFAPTKEIMALVQKDRSKKPAQVDHRHKHDIKAEQQDETNDAHDDEDENSGTEEE